MSRRLRTSRSSYSSKAKKLDRIASMMKYTPCHAQINSYKHQHKYPKKIMQSCVRKEHIYYTHRQHSSSLGLKYMLKLN